MRFHPLLPVTTGGWGGENEGICSIVSDEGCVWLEAIALAFAYS
jgi:hypothetical protein